MERTKKGIEIVFAASLVALASILLRVVLAAVNQMVENSRQLFDIVWYASTIISAVLMCVGCLFLRKERKSLGAAAVLSVVNAVLFAAFLVTLLVNQMVEGFNWLTNRLLGFSSVLEFAIVLCVLVGLKNECGNAATVRFIKRTLVVHVVCFVIVSLLSLLLGFVLVAMVIGELTPFGQAVLVTSVALFLAAILVTRILFLVSLKKAGKDAERGAFGSSDVGPS